MTRSTGPTIDYHEEPVIRSRASTPMGGRLRNWSSVAATPVPPSRGSPSIVAVAPHCLNAKCSIVHILVG